MAIGNGELDRSCTSVFPNTHAWEQQQQNKTKETDEEGEKHENRTSKAGTKKKK